MKRSITTFTLIIAFTLFIVPVVGAHKVTIFAWAEGETVYTQSKFSGGKMVKNGTVEVFDGDGTLLLDGRTNDIGEFSFKAPKIADLSIVLTAGMGHQNKWTLYAAELNADMPNATMPQSASPDQRLSEPHQEPSVIGPHLTPQAVETIVARELERQLQPLNRMMAAAKDRGPTVNDIVGGIGYIIGLVGLGAYVRYRKDSRRS